MKRSYLACFLIIIILLVAGIAIMKKSANNTEVLPPPGSDSTVSTVSPAITAPADSNFECDSDNDCKLIYSNCDCEAVQENDPRTNLENNEVCKWNLCRETNTTAVCKDKKCAKNSLAEKNN